MKTALGDRIRATREAQGKSRQQLASAALTSPQYIHQVETGKIKDPGIDILSRVAVALGLDVDALLSPAQPEPATLSQGKA